MASSQYTRLTRDRITQQFAIVAAPRVSLWLGSDHLLQVQTQGVTETAKRFYFRDIQAIVIQQTARQSIWNVVLSLPLIICLFGIIASLRSTEGVIVWSIFAGILLLPLAINLVRGPTCTCLLRTAVQTENLGSISRIRQARKVLNKIRPLIEAAQGQLTPEEVATKMREAAVAGSSGLPGTP
jgi:hypothetical protein